MSADEFYGWTLAGLGVIGLLGWLVYSLFTAPTEVESTPLDDLLDGQDPAAKEAAKFTRAGWIEEPPGSGYWIKDTGTTPEQRHEARQAYDRRDLLADDECPLEDIALDADALLFMAEVLADIDDQPTYTEGADS